MPFSVAAWDNYAAVIATVILTGVLCGLVGWVLAAQARHLAQELPTHRKEIDEKLAGLRENRGGTFPRLQKMVREVVNGQTEADTVRPKEVSKEPVVVARPPEPSNFEQLISAAGPVVEPLTPDRARRGLVDFHAHPARGLAQPADWVAGPCSADGHRSPSLVESAHRISRFLLTQTLINVGFGTLFALGLLLIGVPYALLWGGLAVVLRFVPFIGSIIASVFPLVLAFAVAPGWTSPVLVPRTRGGAGKSPQPTLPSRC